MNRSNYQEESSDDAAASTTSRPSFPTGDTTPFPYEEPYPQQRDLMDTLLQSLQRLRHSQHDDDDRRRNNCAETNAEASSTNNNCCPVYMLESPTGTGKR